MNAFKNTMNLFIIFLLCTPAFAQQQEYHYSVLHNGDKIGKMSIIQSQSGDELNVKVVSNVQMRMLMTVKVTVAEEAYYKNDKLMQSSIYREVNGKQKANRQTRYLGNCYKTITEGKTGTLNKSAINYNLVKLYCHEPVTIAQVYSDNFQQFFNIKTISEHIYRLDLPDGNYNIYYYKNGICNKVDIHSNLFTIQMQLTI